MKKAKDRRRRNREPKWSTKRFLTQKDLREIRWGVSLANARARREGQVPKDPQVFVSGCRCNCFYVRVT